MASHMRCLLLRFSANILKSVLRRFDALLQRIVKQTTLKNKSVIRALKQKREITKLVNSLKFLILLVSPFGRFQILFNR